MNSFEWKKNTEDTIKDRLINTGTTMWIFFALKAANVKTRKASVDAMHIMKLTGGIGGGVWWKIMQSAKNGSTSDTTKTLWPPMGNKTTQRQM